MIVIERESEENEYGEGAFYEIETPENIISVGHMEPEDATLNRDLSFVYSISRIITEAYKAGKNGEDLIFKQEEVQE